MERIKSVDIFRGICILNFMLVHYLVGWLPLDQLWAFDTYWIYFDMMGSSAFLFISGIGIMLFYKTKMQKVEKSTDFYDKSILRNEYLLRGIFILMISFIWNLAQAIFFYDATWLWRWDIIQAIAMSILIAWPLLKLSKRTRILFYCLFMILHYFLYELLMFYQGQLSVFGGIYYFLYNQKMSAENPLLPSLSIFLIGTVIGDLFFEISHKENEIEKKKSIKNNILLKSMIAGVLLIIFGIIFNYPDFIHNRSYSWWFYVLGWDIIIISLLYSIEKLLFSKYTKRHRFLYYFSYYSLTVFITHDFLGFVFYQSLSIYNTYWIVLILTYIVFGILLKVAYDRVGWKLSIKSIIGRGSTHIALKINEKYPQSKQKLPQTT